jgi:hypothetical protein
MVTIFIFDYFSSKKCSLLGRQVLLLHLSSKKGAFCDRNTADAGKYSLKIEFRIS